MLMKIDYNRARPSLSYTPIIPKYPWQMDIWVVCLPNRPISMGKIEDLLLWTAADRLPTVVTGGSSP